ncbi:uncharacterized protein LOC135837956 [Planococcus citri]|uniref:uncharacterized protein LOC135837956 n=1 Tax=Planococcus citri TaxID=170843 RepID=UPI0031F9C91B
MTDSPMELQCLAAKSVCIRLVREWAEGEIPIIDVWGNDDGYNTCSDHDWFMWQLNEMQVPRFAHIPNKIRYQIEDNLALIIEQVTVWIQYHHSVNFFHDQPTEPISSLSEYVVKLVWNHYFKIDYAATAKNILTNEKLSQLERFRFASTYCIVEEMEKFRDLVVDSVPKRDIVKDPFVLYWSKYLKNEMHVISSVIAQGEGVTIDLTMFIITTEQLELWPPAEYFFDKLDSGSKSVLFERIVERYGNKYLKELLAKLTDEEWRLASHSAISKIVDKIVQYGTSNDVRFVWQLCKNEIDSENFCAILETLVPLSISNSSDFEKWTPLLVEIWTSAASELKQSAIDNVQLWDSICEKFIQHVRTLPIEGFGARRLVKDPLKFLRVVLKNTNAKSKMAFFEQNFYWLIMWAPFTEVDNLLRDSLQHYDRDIVELKKSIANNSAEEVERSLMVFLSFGLFDEFDAVFAFYYPAVIAGDDETPACCLTCHKWKLLAPDNAMIALSTCLYLGDWRRSFEFLKKTLTPMNLDPVEYMVCNMIEIGCKREIYRLMFCDSEMNDLKECLTTILPANDSRLEIFKKRFQTYMLDTIFDCELRKIRVFKRAKVENFLLWICDGDEKLIDEKFKQSSLFPKGFVVQFAACGVFGDAFQATKSMEEYLEWCFATESERQRFKREMIYKYSEYNMIAELLTRRSHRRAMLYWFFDGDHGAIEKFTAEYAGKPIYNLVPVAPDAEMIQRMIQMFNIDPDKIVNQCSFVIR